jgi:sugar/nucleoside kinase (ribokinase family)
VIDLVGAGDGFDAGFLVGWLRGWNLEKFLQLGARLGAAAVEVMGDYEGYPRNLENQNLGVFFPALDKIILYSFSVKGCIA